VDHAEVAGLVVVAIQVTGAQAADLALMDGYLPEASMASLVAD